MEVQKQYLVKLNFEDVIYRYIGFSGVAQWFRCCDTNRKVAGSIPASVSGFFIDIKILPIALWPWGRLNL
jgi:hypothetical protein